MCQGLLYRALDTYSNTYVLQDVTRCMHHCLQLADPHSDHAQCPHLLCHVLQPGHLCVMPAPRLLIRGGTKSGNDLVLRVQVSMSSTSIVVKCLTDTKATGSSHGQITIGTLILQVSRGLTSAGLTCTGRRATL